MRQLPGMPAVAGVFLAMAAVSGVRSLAVAQGYPEKPVMLVVPWPAGGSTDIVMRAISESAASTSANLSWSTTSRAVTAHLGRP